VYLRSRWRLMTCMHRPSHQCDWPVRGPRFGATATCSDHRQRQWRRAVGRLGPPATASPVMLISLTKVLANGQNFQTVWASGAGDRWLVRPRTRGRVTWQSLPFDPDLVKSVLLLVPPHHRQLVGTWPQERLQIYDKLEGRPWRDKRDLAGLGPQIAPKRLQVSLSACG
jgi:hypothetical protein